ncbi:hypothetical protein B7486_56430, partial [cyanobacterium TDX16]
MGDLTSSARASTWSTSFRRATPCQDGSMAARIRGLAPAAALERAGAVATMVGSADGRRALRWRPRSVAAWRLVQGVLACGVHPGTVLDVGANAGQFARASVELLGCAVHSFEPLPVA